MGKVERVRKKPGTLGADGVKAFRDAWKLTQAQLAQATGASVKTISNYEQRLKPVSPVFARVIEILPVYWKHCPPDK